MTDLQLIEAYNIIASTHYQFTPGFVGYPKTKLHILAYCWVVDALLDLTPKLLNCPANCKINWYFILQQVL
jgi:hypothetical protein